MKTPAIIFLSCFLLAVQIGEAQSVRIQVTDEKKGPLNGANIQLTKMPDSTAVFGVTNQSGIAVVEKVSDGPYLLRISYVGFESVEAQIVVSAARRSFSYVLKEESVTLGAVEVTAKKPLVTQDGDRMIVDPEPLASISTNALEVLEAVPGLFVDQDGGVFLSNASPAQIYINGREQRMGSQDMAAILRSLPPGSIQRIEVLRTPSTKYDAASSGGIVNIVLKKGVKLGRFGSINLSMNQGVYGNQSAGFSLNNGAGKSAWYLNANYNHNEGLDDNNLFRILNPASNLDQTARTQSRGDQGNAGFGMSFDFSDAFSLSYDGRFNAGANRSENRNLSRTGAPGEPPLSEIDNTVDNSGSFLSLQQDLSLAYKIDTTGSNWETKLGYSFRRGNSDQDYRADFLFPALNPVAGEGENIQDRQFFLMQSDLTYNLPRQTKIEAGVKGAYQDYRSDAEYFLRANGGLVPDLGRTNAFNYQERILAAYAQASRPLAARFVLKAGLRLEHTWMKGRQTVPGDTSFLINRADFFPYLFLSRPIVKIAGFELNGYLIYRRTIDRPGYQNLNPFVRYIDEFSYESGNPALQPQFTQNVEANISFNDTPILAIGRNYTDGIFSSVLYQDASRPEIAVRTYDNVGKSRETYFRVMGGVPPGKTFFFAAGAQYNLNDYDGLYFNQPLSFRRGSWRLFTFQSLNITRETRLTLSGFIMFRGQQNFNELDDFGQLNMSLNQYFLDRKLQISLFGRDVLRTMQTRYQLNQGGVYTSGDRYSDNQRFGCQIRYNFGFRKREERREMMPFEVEE